MESMIEDFSHITFVPKDLETSSKEEEEELNDATSNNEEKIETETLKRNDDDISSTNQEDEQKVNPNKTMETQTQSQSQSQSQNQRKNYYNLPQSKKLFVGGLADGTTMEDFENYFAKFGTITDHVVIHNRITKKPRGFGFVSFDSDKAVNAVLQNQHHILNNKKVEVTRAKAKEVTVKTPNYLFLPSTSNSCYHYPAPNPSYGWPNYYNNYNYCNYNYNYNYNYYGNSGYGQYSQYPYSTTMAMGDCMYCNSSSSSSSSNGPVYYNQN